MDVQESTSSMPYGALLWEPTPKTWEDSQLGKYVRWLADERGLNFSNREDLWKWSVTELEQFWGSIWDYFAVESSEVPVETLTSRTMPGAQWFPGAKLNYAQHALRSGAAGEWAVRGFSQTRSESSLTFGQLRKRVSQMSQFLQHRGVRQGDRVVAYAPNIPETVVAFLATASLGATFSSCSIEFGSRSVLDRFGQLDPTILVTVGGYQYGDKTIDKTDDVRTVVQGLPSLTTVIDLEYGSHRIAQLWQEDDGETVRVALAEWSTLLDEFDPFDLEFAQVPFDHPLVVLFSSGTTGLPKAIVHGHGGVLLEHFKNHSLSWDLRQGDVFMWYSTPSWMMWNSLVSGLLTGSTIICLDGNPVHPTLGWQWEVARETGVTVVGVAPGYLMSCRKAGINPAEILGGNDLRVFASAGAPLPPEGYRWVYEQFPDIWLNTGSGGTDVCSGIVQGDPLLPVWAGAISGPALGVAAAAFDEQGRPVTGQLGELVITEPMPSMPVGFYGDDDGSKLRAAYFDHYPGIWRHGDWIEFAPAGYCKISGRSDATLNRGGVRLGTAEFYTVTEDIPGIADSLVIHLETLGENGELIMFVELEPGVRATMDLRRTVVSTLRTELSPRHVPDRIVVIPKLPRNRTGKKLELPAKKLLQGQPIEKVASVDTLADPTSLDFFVSVASNGWGDDGWVKTTSNSGLQGKV